MTTPVRLNTKPNPHKSDDQRRAQRRTRRQNRKVERVQGAEQPAIGAARRIEFFQQRAARPVDVKPIAAADHTKYRRAGHVRRDRIVIVAIDDSATASQARARWLSGGVDLVRVAETPDPEMQHRCAPATNSRWRSIAGALAPVNPAAECKPFHFAKLPPTGAGFRHAAAHSMPACRRSTAASASAGLPVENKTPLSIDSQPLNIQVRTNSMQHRPSQWCHACQPR